MNFDLALMALDGLTRHQLEIVVTSSGEVTIGGEGPAFRELARLCLLLGAEETPKDEEIQLKPSLHLKAGSGALRLRRR